MLKKFINALTWNKVIVNLKWTPTKEEVEEQIWMEIKWDWPLATAAKKRWRPKKDQSLDSNNEE